MTKAPATLLLLTALATAFAQAQSGPPASMEPVTVYPVDVFADTAPAHALDMVLRLPGFVIVDADSDKRGYAGAQGNVLVDGVRPTSKHEDVEDMLERIPADSVKQIELIRAGLSGINMAGHAVLVNVVRTVTHEQELVLEAGLVAAPGGWIKPSGQLEFSRRQDEHSLQLLLSSSPELDDDSGSGHVITKPTDGELKEHGRTRDLEAKSETEAGINWSQPLRDGTLRITSTARQEKGDVLSQTYSLIPESEYEIESEAETATEAELGVSFSRKLSSATAIELLMSQQKLWRDSTSRSSKDEGFSEETSDSGESIVRLELTHQTDNQVDLSSAVEGAFNRLQGRANLRRGGTPVEIPGSEVDIQEQRAEASVHGTWAINNRWRMETGLRVELSRIEQKGDSPLTRSFTYTKPHLAMNWRADKRNRLRFALEREIGQLDFEDFVASAAIDTGTISAGNSWLEPDKTWRASVGWERSLGESGALRLTWEHDRISDVIDRILIFNEDGGTFDAPGNIGDGTRNSFTAELSRSLDPWGFQGLRFVSVATRRFSRVTDPITGETRSISGEPSYEGEISLTQARSTTPWSWGVTLELAETEREFLYDEVSVERSGYELSVFVERRIGTQWRLTAEVINPLGRTFTSSRTQFGALRSQATPDELELREHNMPAQVMVTLRRSTGS